MNKRIAPQRHRYLLQTDRRATEMTVSRCRRWGAGQAVSCEVAGRASPALLSRTIESMSITLDICRCRPPARCARADTATLTPAQPGPTPCRLALPRPPRHPSRSPPTSKPHPPRAATTHAHTRTQPPLALHSPASSHSPTPRPATRVRLPAAQARLPLSPLPRPLPCRRAAGEAERSVWGRRAGGRARAAAAAKA